MKNITVKAVEALKAKDKTYKKSLGDGLQIEIKPNGRKTFYIRYRKNGRDIIRSLGQFPNLTLQEARQKALEAQKTAPEVEAINKATLQEVITKFTLKKEKEATQRGKPTSFDKERIRLDKYLSPLYSQAVAKINYNDILKILLPIEEAGKLETMHRVKRVLLECLTFAKSAGYDVSFSIAEAREKLRNVLVKRQQTEHYVTVTDPETFKKLLEAIKSHSNIVMRNLILFQILTLTRPGEARQAEWQEIDFDKAIWTIPAIKMKKSREHIVPLSRQAIALLEELKPITGEYKYIFPQANNRAVPISNNGARVVLQNMAKKLGLPLVTPHGFRATASTVLNANGWAPDVIEAALAHSADAINPIRAAYNRHAYFDERKEMLQWYADFLENLKD